MTPIRTAPGSIRRLPRACLLAALLWLLTACGSKPPAHPWQVRSLASLNLAQSAYLDGDDRVATLELGKARQQVSRTGDPAELARLELRHCAVQVASLDWHPCGAFTPLANAATAEEQAYAAYLQGQPLTGAQRGLLPPAQQRIAGYDTLAPASLSALTGIDDPLSRLLAAALLSRRAGDVSPELMQLAIDTASTEGWRRPLLAWLLRQRQYAQARQLVELQAQAELRIRILEQQGRANLDIP